MSGDPDRDTARALRLRNPPPPVTRLSRRAMMVLAAGASTVLALAAAWGLQQRPTAPSAAEPIPPAAAAPPEAVTRLPKDYVGLPPGTPKLGPPLPGDLGRPLLSGGGEAPLSGTPPSAADAEAERRAQALDAARRSALFGGSSGLRAATSAPAAAPITEPVAPPASRADPKLAFLGGTGEAAAAPARLLPAPPNALLAGTIVAAALVTGIRSDLPGPVIAQVTEDVFDTVTGKILLVPQGSRLIGMYDHQVAFGQNRVLLVWTRLIMPDGRSIVLPREAAADPRGFAGLADRVDRHWRQLFGAAAVSTLLGVGAEIGAGPRETDLARAVREGFAGSANQAGQQLVGKSLDVQPTLTIRPGYPVRALLTRDLVLEPYERAAWAS